MTPAALHGQAGESSRRVHLWEAWRGFMFVVVKEHVYFNLRGKQ